MQRNFSDKIIECKEFEEQNRGTFDQVTTDISRLVEQISDPQRIESESIDGIAATEQQISDVESTLAEEKKVYDQMFVVLLIRLSSDSLSRFLTSSALSLSRLIGLLPLSSRFQMLRPLWQRRRKFMIKFTP